MIFITAEIGVNWDGDFDLAKEMMKNAKEAGCNAVKFQAFDEKIIGNHSEKTRLMKSAISETNAETINELSKSVGIEWFCTPTYTEAVDFLAPYVKRFKSRFADQNNERLLSKVFATKKQVIISTQNPEKFASAIKTLYCIPKYPSNFDEIEFDKMPLFYGYSNHCKEKRAVVEAARRGARMLEIHVTPSYDKAFIDNPVSFDMNDLGDIISQIRKF